MKRPAGLSKSSKSNKKARVDESNGTTEPEAVDEIQVASTGSSLDDLRELRVHHEQADTLEESVNWLRGLINEANRLLSLRNGNHAENDEEILPATEAEWASVQGMLGYGLYTLGYTLDKATDFLRQEGEPEDFTTWLEASAGAFSDAWKDDGNHINDLLLCLDYLLLLAHQITLPDSSANLLSKYTAVCLKTTQLVLAYNESIDDAYQLLPTLEEQFPYLSTFSHEQIDTIFPHMDLLLAEWATKTAKNKAVLHELRGDLALLHVQPLYQDAINEYFGEEANNDEWTLPDELGDELRFLYRKAIQHFEHCVSAESVPKKMAEAYISIGNLTESESKREEYYKSARALGVDI